MNIEEIKMDHFENFEELIKTCKMWIIDDDIDAYYRFFEFNCMKTLVTAYEKEKRLAEANLKDSEEFQDNMCNHRCILNSKVEELEAELEKEKERNKELKWKPIKDYNRKKYDWVLVKYFDGDYECVPEVAEKRSDGKWYTSERQIPFEVKYFFDMQEILEEE